MTVQVRIVAGSLRGRKLLCTAVPQLRPTPDMVRQALFSILGNAVPDRGFVDLFAGSGVVGLEAVSRGALRSYLVERDFRLANDLDKHVREFGVGDRVQVLRADVYRWVERWRPPPDPVTVFVSPPFVDYEKRLPELLQLAAGLQEKLPVGSVLVLQGERGLDLTKLPGTDWDVRTYGRNQLLFWVKPSADGSGDTPLGAGTEPESLSESASEELPDGGAGGDAGVDETTPPGVP